MSSYVPCRLLRCDYKQVDHQPLAASYLIMAALEIPAAENSQRRAAASDAARRKRNHALSITRLAQDDAETSVYKL